MSETKGYFSFFLLQKFMHTCTQNQAKALGARPGSLLIEKRGRESDEGESQAQRGAGSWGLGTTVGALFGVPLHRNETRWMDGLGSVVGWPMPPLSMER